MDIQFCFDYPFDEKTRKKHKLVKAYCLNGFYIYNTDQAFINVGSRYFTRQKNESVIQKAVTNTATHETLHKVIYDITGKDANKTEEKIVDLMVNG